MKRSDTASDTVSGKFLVRAKPLGTVTEEMVLRRAKEMAITRGRRGNDFTQDDVDAARRELVGYPVDDENVDVPATGTWLSDATDSGHQAPVRPAPDEQTVAEKLVAEGVEEATHHQMLAGNDASRKADQI